MYFNKQPVFFADNANYLRLGDWRTHTNSLTEKLHAAKGDTELELISQKWVLTSWWDTYLLGIKDGQVFQREIIMKNHNTPYWYARTVIPYTSFHYEAVFFIRLENESIKNLIFGNDKVKRISLIDYPVNEKSIEYHWVKKYLPHVNGVMWVRLAEYLYKNSASFYITEVLLPDLESLA